MSTDNFNFYVYAYLRDDGTPYYVGKGQKKRAYQKMGKEISPPKDRTKIIIVSNNLSDIGALAIERRLIRWYGRKDIGTGILRNRTDGGDGAAGAIRSETHKQAISDAIKGRNQTWRRRKVQLDDGRIFDTIKEAASHLGITGEGVRYRCSIGLYNFMSEGYGIIHTESEAEV